MEHEGNTDIKCNWCVWNDPQRLGKRVGKIGNRRTSRDHPNYSILKIGQNTDKSPGDLRGTDATQIPVKDYQLRLE